MSGCKVLEQGSEVEHYGQSLGRGFYVHRDEESGHVTICRHPGDNVRAVPDVAVTLTAEEWEAAKKNAGRIPKPKVVIPKPKVVEDLEAERDVLPKKGKAKS